jgi:predicted phage-related endonuclease
MRIFRRGREYLVLRKEEVKLKKPRRLFNPNTAESEERKVLFWELREKNMIGGSYAPSIMAGIDGTDIQYGSPLQAYCKLKGKLKKLKKDGMWWGHKIEPIIRKDIPEILKYFSDDVRVRSDKYLYVSSEYPWMIGQLDGYVRMKKYPDQKGGIEIKLRGVYDSPNWEAGKIPDYVLFQIAHYMAVFPVDYFLIIVFFGDWNINYRVVTREKLQNKIDMVIREEKKFRENYLIPEELPDPIGAKADYDVLEEVMKIGIYEDGHEIDDETMERIAHYQEMGKNISMMQRERLKFKNLILASLAGHKTGLYKGKPACKVSLVKPKRVCNDWLKRDGLYEKYLKESPYKRLDVIKR